MSTDMSELIYEILTDEGETVYARGGDKNEAWGKVQFSGSMIDSMTEEEFRDRFQTPEVL